MHIFYNSDNLSFLNISEKERGVKITRIILRIIEKKARFFYITSNY